MQNLRRLRTETAMANYPNFHLELDAAHIRYAQVRCGFVRRSR